MSQQQLFPDTPKKPPKDDFLQRQFERLGEMIGDGLHLEPDGKWITRDYRRIMNILYPDILSDQRKRNNESTDAQMATLLAKTKSACCNAVLIQARKGAKVCYCTKCKIKYKAKATKKTE